MYKVYGNVLSTGTKERTKEVLGGFGHKRLCVCVLWQSQSYGDRDVPITVLKYDSTVVVGTF